MSVAALKNFLEVEQKQEISEDEWSEIVRSFYSSEEKLVLSKEGFTQFLMFNDFMEVVSPDTKTRVKTEDMTSPLAHYWIASSHNT